MSSLKINLETLIQHRVKSWKTRDEVKITDKDDLPMECYRTMPTRVFEAKPIDVSQLNKDNDRKILGYENPKNNEMRKVGEIWYWRAHTWCACRLTDYTIGGWNLCEHHISYNLHECKCGGITKCNGKFDPHPEQDPFIIRELHSSKEIQEAEKRFDEISNHVYNTPMPEREIEVICNKVSQAGLELYPESKHFQTSIHNAKIEEDADMETKEPLLFEISTRKLFEDLYYRIDNTQDITMESKSKTLGHITEAKHAFILRKDNKRKAVENDSSSNKNIET